MDRGLQSGLIVHPAALARQSALRPPAAPSHHHLARGASSPPAQPSGFASFTLTPVIQRRIRSGATSSARSREPGPRQAPPGAAARSHSSMRLPEPLVAAGVAMLEVRDGVGGSHCRCVHQPRWASGSAGTTPSSTKTTGTTNSQRPIPRREDGFQIFHVKRRAFARIPSSRNDAFQQHDPTACTRRNLPVPMRWPRRSDSRGAQSERSDESTNSQAAAV
jgi:hypothetical protein